MHTIWELCPAESTVVFDDGKNNQVHEFAQGLGTKINVVDRYTTPQTLSFKVHSQDIHIHCGWRKHILRRKSMKYKYPQRL